MLRALLLPLVLLSAACAGEGATAIFPPPPPPPAIHSVTVSPGDVTLAPGDSVQFSAVVVGAPGVSKEVRWSSRHPETVTVSPTGLAVAPRCGPDERTVVEAVAVADSTKRGHAFAGRWPRSVGFPVISRITDSATGADARLLDIRGTVRVVVPHPRPGCPMEVDSLRLAASGPGIDTVFAAQAVTGTLDGPFTLYWQTAAIRAGVPAFPNGQYGLRVQAIVGHNAPHVAMVVPLQLTNP